MDATISSIQSEKPARSVARSVGLIVGLVAVYILSAGTAVYWMNKSGMVSLGMFKALDVAFTPACLLYPYCGRYRDYFNWFAERERDDDPLPNHALQRTRHSVAVCNRGR
jgi:hypothetical protein